MRFKPSRFSILPLVCAALLTLLCLLWLRTRRHTAIFGFFTPSGHLQAIASDRDGLLIFLSDVPFGAESAWSADAMNVSSDDFAAAHDLVYDAAKTHLPGHWHFAGFRYAKDQLAPTPTITWDFRAITIPYWLPIVLLAILPMQRLQRWAVRRRRLRRGQCPACGYDLRHSRQRCPECGRLNTRNNKKETDTVNPRQSSRVTTDPRRVAGWFIFLSAVGMAAVVLMRGSRLEARSFAADNHTNHLNQTLGQLNAWGTSLDEMLGCLRQSSPVAIVEDQRPSAPLLPSGRQAPVYVRLNHVDLSAALATLRQVSDPPFNFEYRDGSVHLGPSGLTVHTYRVEGLLRKLDSTAEEKDFEDLKHDPNPLFGPITGSFLDQLVLSLTPPDDDTFTLLFGNRLIVARTQCGHVYVRDLLRNALPAALSDTVPARLPRRTAPREHANLDLPIADLDVHAPTLTEALDYIQRQTQANLVVDWASIQEEGFPLNQPIKLRLWDTTLGSALSAVFAAAGERGDLMIASKGDIILIGSGRRNTLGEIRVYDVRDIVDHFAPFEKAKQLTFGPQTPGGSPTRDWSLQQVVDGLVKLIEDEVDTDSWKDNGGALGAVRELGGRLIINQSPANHERIAQFLRTLRAGGSKEGMRIQDAPETQPSRP